MRPLLPLFLLAVLTLPGWGQVRFDTDLQWRLAEGSVATGPGHLQGRFVSLAESYFIVDPVVTLGLENRGPGWSLGLGVRGLFPHPLAGETRVGPLVWAEVDLGWFGGRFDLGTGYAGFPAGGFTRWVGDLVPTLAFFTSVPAWKLSAGRLEWQPRLTGTFRGFLSPQGYLALNPFTVSLGAGFATHF